MARGVHSLTEREEQVLTLLRKGYSQVRIAALLHVEVQTIYQYSWVIRDKLQVHSTNELIARSLIMDEGAV